MFCVFFFFCVGWGVRHRAGAAAERLPLPACWPWDLGGSREPGPAAFLGSNVERSWSDPFGKGKSRSFRARRDARGPGMSCGEVLPVAVGLNPGWKRTGRFIWYIVGRGGAEGHGEKRRLGVSGNLQGGKREAAFFPASAVTVRAEGSPPATASLFAEVVLGWRPVWFRWLSEECRPWDLGFSTARKKCSGQVCASVRDHRPTGLLCQARKLQKRRPCFYGASL